MTRDYYQELAINKYDLEEEWIRQSEKCMYWSEQAAKAQTEFKDVEMERNIKKAELYKKYRAQLEEEKDKVSDAMITAYIRTDPEYRTLTQKLYMAQENASIMEAAKWNFTTRKTSLEKIQEGIISGFFSDPRDKKTEEKLRNKMEERRR
jgi:hypothetical protein